MAVNVRPLHDRILIRVVEEDEVGPAGIIIPDTARERPQQGEVIAVGKGAIMKDGSRRPVDVQAGDRVLFTKYGGSELPRVLKYGGEEYLILREEEILAVLEPGVPDDLADQLAEARKRSISEAPKAKK